MRSIKTITNSLLLKGGYLSHTYPWIQEKFLNNRRLSILMYHAVIDKSLPVSDWCFMDAELFHNQLVYLKNNFNVVSLREAASLSQKGKIKNATAVVTFDDGFQNNFDIAFPILQELQIPATIFLSSGLIDTEETVWFCRVNKAIAETTQKELVWLGERYGLENTKVKAQSSARLQAKLKKLEHFVLFDELEKISISLAVSFNSPIPRYSPYRMLDRNSIDLMISSGIIEFGAHTVNHTILTKLPKEIAAVEVIDSVKSVSRLIKNPCVFFSYPNGRYQDFDENCVNLLQDHGVTVAVTTMSGTNNVNTPLMKLKRYGISSDMTIERFSFTIHGFLESFRALKAKFLRRKEAA